MAKATTLQIDQKSATAVATESSCSGSTSRGNDSGTLSSTTSAHSGDPSPGVLTDDISFLTALSSASGFADVALNKETLQAWPSAGGSCARLALTAREGAREAHTTDLGHFHAQARILTALHEGHYSKVRSLSDCCRNEGKVELHRWHEAECEDDRLVVVKRILRSRVYMNEGKETDERAVHRRRIARDSEDTLTEIGVYCLLSKCQDLPEYILKMHSVFAAGSDVWLVLEQADGGDLFSTMQHAGAGQGLPESKVMRWTWQLLQAVSYLHRLRIGHRDISTENVLLRGGAVRLMDFGQAVQTHSAEGEALRYFVPAGKPYHRGPECYVPTDSEIQVLVPPQARAGQVLFTQSATGEFLCEVLPITASGTAEPCGYLAAPADIFACGVCCFIMATGLPPWRKARPVDAHFKFAFVHGLPRLLKSWSRNLPELEQQLLVSMLRWDPSQRPSAAACLQHQWFTPLHGISVPTHKVAPPASPPPEAEAEASDITRLIQGLTAGGAGGSAHGDAYGVRQTGLTADWYSHEEVCRGEASLEEPSSVVVLGDFYGSMDDRDETAPPLCLDLPGQMGPELRLDRADEPGLAPTLARFEEGDTPPRAPEDADFRLEPTTLHFSGSAPADVGNHLLAFLTARASARVDKVNRQKFSVKAAFEGEAGACVLKVRIYSLGEDRHALEFQRRSGDAMAMHLLYQKAVDYLGQLVQALTPEGSRASTPSSQPYDGEEMELGQLKDWADPGVRGLLKRNRRHRHSAAVSR